MPPGQRLVDGLGLRGHLSELFAAHGGNRAFRLAQVDAGVGRHIFHPSVIQHSEHSVALCRGRSGLLLQRRIKGGLRTPNEPAPARRQRRARVAVLMVNSVTRKGTNSRMRASLLPCIVVKALQKRCIRMMMVMT